MTTVGESPLAKHGEEGGDEPMKVLVYWKLWVLICVPALLLIICTSMHASIGGLVHLVEQLPLLL